MEAELQRHALLKVCAQKLRMTVRLRLRLLRRDHERDRAGRRPSVAVAAYVCCAAAALLPPRTCGVVARLEVSVQLPSRSDVEVFGLDCCIAHSGETRRAVFGAARDEEHVASDHGDERHRDFTVLLLTVGVYGCSKRRGVVEGAHRRALRLSAQSRERTELFLSESQGELQGITD